MCAWFVCCVGRCVVCRVGFVIVLFVMYVCLFVCLLVDSSVCLYVCMFQGLRLCC